MTQKDKKMKGKRTGIERRTGQILEIVELKYIVRILCWCGEQITIDSTKPMTENECKKCGSPYKFHDAEWTPEEMQKYAELKGLQVQVQK